MSGMNCYFVSDLHGSVQKYQALFRLMKSEPPEALFIGGDIFPGAGSCDSAGIGEADFVNGFLSKEFGKIMSELGDRYPEVFIILGNDDGRAREAALIDAGIGGLWRYCHMRTIEFMGYEICGYSYVPPSPFRLKDWERYDVSRYLDPGCIAPSDGIVTVPVSDYELNYGTIAEDLEQLTGERDLGRTIMLFHAPPYKTNLDRAALDGKFIDYVPLDVHIGSIAIKEMIKEKKPMITLHGHVHESSGITGKWRDRLNSTDMFSAAYDGDELALVKFNAESPEVAERLILPVDH